MKRNFIAAAFVALTVVVSGCGGSTFTPNQTELGALVANDDYANNRYYDVYTFQATRSGTIRIEMTSNQLDPYLIVEDENGDQITFNDDGGPGDDVEVSFNVQAGEIFDVITTTSPANQLGDYDLSYPGELDLLNIRSKKTRTFEVKPKGSVEPAVKTVR